MRFEIRNSKYSQPYELVILYPELKKYDFKVDYPYPNANAPRATIYFNNLEDLLKLKSEVKQEIILDDVFKAIDNVRYVLEIYDDYRE